MAKSPMAIISASFFLALSTAIFAEEYQVRTDKTIEAGAAARAAKRVGDIRGTISFDKIPVFVRASDLSSIKAGRTENSDLSPRPSWVPPVKDNETLPPLVTREYLEGLDQTLTGSINRPIPKRRNFEWEIFDSNGNRIIFD